MKKDIKLVFGYVLYNVIFWVYYYIRWLRRKVKIIGRLFSCNFLGICNRDLKDILMDHYKKIVFITYFGKNDYREKVLRQEIFSIITDKLTPLHRTAFGYDGVSFKTTNNSSLKDTSESIVFVSFHTVSAYRRIINIAKRFDVEKIGIVVKDRATFTQKLLKNYGVNIPEEREFFELGGIEAKICSIKDTQNPAKRHSEMSQMLKNGRSMFINYDIPTSQEKLLKQLFNDAGKLNNPSKYYTFSYNNKKLLMVSKYLLYLIKKSGSVALPVFTRRLKDGRDVVVLGDVFSIGQNEKIIDREADIFDTLFSFMSKNVLASGWGWENASNLAKLVPFLRKSGTRLNGKKWPNSNVKKTNLKLSSNVLISKYDKNSYLITSTSPIKSIKVGKFTKKVVKDLKRNDTITRRFRDRVSLEKLESSLENLWKAGIIEEAD